MPNISVLAAPVCASWDSQSQVPGAPGRGRWPLLIMKTCMVVLICAAFGVTTSLAGSTSTNAVARGLFRTVVDENAGRYAAVDSSKEVVTLFDRSNKVLWTTNIVAGLKAAPVMGERKISGMQVWKGELLVHVGRGYGVVDVKTGALRGFNQN